MQYTQRCAFCHSILGAALSPAALGQGALDPPAISARRRSLRDGPPILNDLFLARLADAVDTVPQWSTKAADGLPD